MNKNLGRRIHPIAEADGLSPKKLVIITTMSVGMSLNITLVELKKRNNGRD